MSISQARRLGFGLPQKPAFPSPFGQPSKNIAEFCAKKRISRSKYFEMRKKGKGPRESRDGRWVTITPEAEADWDRERESEQATDQDD